MDHGLFTTADGSVESSPTGGVALERSVTSMEVEAAAFRDNCAHERALKFEKKYVALKYQHAKDVHEMSEKLQMRERQLVQCMDRFREATEQIGALQEREESSNQHLKAQLDTLHRENCRLIEEHQANTGVFGENFKDSFLEVQLSNQIQLEQEMSELQAKQAEVEGECRRLTVLNDALESDLNRELNVKEQVRDRLMKVIPSLLQLEETKEIADELVSIVDQHLSACYSPKIFK